MQIPVQILIKKITRYTAYLKPRITLNFSMESREKISQAASISLPIMERMDSCSISKWCSWSLNLSLASSILLKWSSSLLICLSCSERGKRKQRKNIELIIYIIRNISSNLTITLYSRTEFSSFPCKITLSTHTHVSLDAPCFPAKCVSNVKKHSW